MTDEKIVRCTVESARRTYIGVMVSEPGTLRLAVGEAVSASPTRQSKIHDSTLQSNHQTEICTSGNKVESCSSSCKTWISWSHIWVQLPTLQIAGYAKSRIIATSSNAVVAW